MNRIAEVFGAAHVLLPVVHPISRQAALDAVAVAQELGVRGVFLIDQGMRERDVLQLVRTLRDRHPALWIGVNLLSRQPADALKIALDACETIDGIWSDNAGIDFDECGAGGTTLQGERFLGARHAASWSGLYFGGVAFKYQPEVPFDDLAPSASAAVSYLDVLCTSGPGTGYAADVGKVRALRDGLGDHAMALASGVTPDNVGSYMPYVQAFLVGTGIERSLGVFDPAKIEALLHALRSTESSSRQSEGSVAK